MNTQEIITFFKNKETQNTCGRFNNNQLKTYNQESPKKHKLSFLSGIALACLALFSSITAQAQEVKKTITSADDNSKIEANKSEKNIIVKGNVSENNQPLPGANVILQGSTISIATDFDGNFEFPEKLKKGDVLIISYIGFEAQKVVIENNKSAAEIDLKIDMEMTSCVIMGEVAVKKVYQSKRN